MWVFVVSRMVNELKLNRRQRKPFRRKLFRRKLSQRKLFQHNKWVHPLFMVGLLLCLCGELSFAAPPGLTELTRNIEQLKQKHHQRTNACFSCHQDTEAAVFKAAMTRNCVQCHPTGWAKAKLATLADLAKATTGSAETFSQHAKGQGPGMQVPIYYEKSLRGDKPNPMVKIPAGVFIRGSNSRLPDEGPQHEMNVAAFAMDLYEVTNLQYQAFLQSHPNLTPPQHFQNAKAPSGKLDHPVVYVSWYDAKAYCEWVGKRLPNDIEWEKAARGTDGRTYPWGEEFSIERVNSPVRWTTLKRVGDTTPVGAFEAGKSIYGLYDMSGNVWEWTQSGYEPYPGNTRHSENYGGNYRTLKGGSWWDCSFYQCGISAPVYNRSFFHPKTKNNSFGFRCAK